MWLSVDPMADKYPSISPYAYCAWNPVKLVDPDGMEAIVNDDGWLVNNETKTVTHVDYTGGYSQQTVNYTNGQQSQTYFSTSTDVFLQQYTQQGYTIEGYNTNTSTLSPLHPYSIPNQNGLDPMSSGLNGVSVGLNLGSAAFGLGSNICYNKKLTGTWLGRNGKFYNMNFNGNGYTGGRNIFAKARASNLTKIGTGFSLSSLAVSMEQYSNKEISGAEFFLRDGISTALGFVPEVGWLLSGAWQIGFNLGQKYGFLHKLLE